MTKPRVLVLRAPGTNCDAETAFAFEQAGAVAECVHVNRLLEDGRMLERYQILAVPGGFCYGDDVAAGKILASKLQHHLFDCLCEFHAAGNLLLGICNGFQVLLKSGILFADPRAAPPATLTWNDHGRYEARWVTMRPEQTRCVFLRGIDTLYLPMAHAEGKFIVRDVATMRELEAQGQIALRYAIPSPEVAPRVRMRSAVNAGSSASEHEPTVIPFPYNPNGSQGAVAGLCDPSGRAFGLMPHPERYVERTQHPRWTREILPETPDGMRIFRNAVEFFA
jgi:phosphoribosylformylglycinamidine synthase